MNRARKVLLLLLITTALLIIEGQKSKPLAVKFSNVAFYCNPEFFTNCLATIKPNRESYNATVTALRAIYKGLFLKTSLSIKHDATYREIFTTAIEMCRFMDGVSSQTGGRQFMQNVLKYSTFPHKCPLLKGDYAIKNFKVSRKLLPVPFLKAIYKLETIITIRNHSESILLVNATVEAEVM